VKINGIYIHVVVRGEILPQKRVAWT